MVAMLGGGYKNKPMSREAFIRTVAGLQRYEWTTDEGWTGEMAEDALETVNRLIWEANEILNAEAKVSAD
jgi:acetoin utilization deacetylase AcuC-like enzyme